MADLYADLNETRRQNLGKLVTALERMGALRPSLDAQVAQDTLWSVVSPELWWLRANQLRTTPDTPHEWIRIALNRLLLA